MHNLSFPAASLLPLICEFFENSKIMQIQHIFLFSLWCQKIRCLIWEVAKTQIMLVTRLGLEKDSWFCHRCLNKAWQVLTNCLPRPPLSSSSPPLSAPPLKLLFCLFCFSITSAPFGWSYQEDLHLSCSSCSSLLDATVKLFRSCQSL